MTRQQAEFLLPLPLELYQKHCKATNMLDKDSFRLSCFLLAMLPNVLAATSPQCYFPAGNLATDYLPCTDTSNSAQSSCCHLADSVCTANGYCVGSNGLFYRGACTDSTFTSPSCPQMCKNAFASTFSAFFNCANPGTYSQTWCCATESSDSCCSSGFSVDFGNPFQPNATQTLTVAAITTASSTSALSSPSTSSSTSSSPAAAATSSPAASISSSRTKNGTIIGVGVGVGLGIGLLAIAAVWYTIFTQKRRRKQAETMLEEKSKEFDARKEMLAQKVAAQNFPMSGARMEDMDGLAAKHASEIAAGRQRYELDQS